MKFVILLLFVACVVQQSIGGGFQSCGKKTEKIDLKEDNLKSDGTIKTESDEDNFQVELEKNYDQILHKLEYSNHLKFVTQLLDTRDLFNIMITSSKCLQRITGSSDNMKNHLNQEFIIKFPKIFLSKMPDGLRILDYFKMYCVYEGDNEKKVIPIICHDDFIRTDVQKCEEQLKKFMKTLRPGSIKISGRNYNNFLEYQNSETIVFNIENSHTENVLVGKVPWKCKRFPIMIKFNHKKFVSEYFFDARQEYEDDDELITFSYSNSNDRIQIFFKKIIFSNPPGFVVHSATLITPKGDSQISPIQALDMFFHGLWCDVQQLEEFTRIEDFKNTLRPRGIYDCYHNKLTFPRQGVFELKFVHLLAEKLAFVWEHDTFPLTIKHKGKGYIFQSVNMRNNQYSEWWYAEALKNQIKRKQRDHIRIYFPRQLNFWVDQNTFGDFAYKAELTLIPKEHTNFIIVRHETVNAVEAFKEGFWCDIKRIEAAVQEFQDEIQKQ